MIKTLFNRISIREKILLSIFVWFMLGWWLLSLLGSLSGLSQEWNMINSALESEAAIIARAPAVEAALADQLAVLNPSLTLANDELAGRVDRIARNLRLQFDLDPQSPQSIEDFTIYRLKIRIRNAPLEQLMHFNDAILEQSPYMKIESLSMNVNRSNRNQLTATFNINSFEQTQNPDSDVQL